MSLYIPNRLAFPAGRAPGIDLTHPASFPRLRLSVISAVGQVQAFDLATGKKGSVAGAPTFVMNSGIGPAGNFQGATDEITFTGRLTTAPTSTTLAVIVYLTNASTGNFIGDNNFIAFISASSNVWNLPVVTTTLSTAANRPSFFAYCSSTTGGSVAVLKYLDNGSLQTFTSATNLTSSALNSTYFFGGASSTPAGGYVAAGMMSDANLSLNQLVQWSDDPWAFWYPDIDGPLVGGVGLAFNPQMLFMV